MVQTRIRVRPSRYDARPAARGAPVEVGRSNTVIEPLAIALDPAGYVTAAWTHGNSLHSSVYDAVAPALDALTVPARAVVGQTVALSVALFDLWRPPGGGEVGLR